MAGSAAVCFSHTPNEGGEASDPCEQENNYIHGHHSVSLTASHFRRGGVKTALILAFTVEPLPVVTASARRPFVTVDTCPLQQQRLQDWARY